MYNPSGAQRSANFFIPSLPVKRHPQLEKIETYFVSFYIGLTIQGDCTEEFIPATPLIRIPKMLNLKKNTHIPSQTDLRIDTNISHPIQISTSNGGIDDRAIPTDISIR